MLVGLLPLAVSLIVILVGGAAIQLSRIQRTYEDTAADCGERISDALVHEEFEKLLLITRLPSVVDYARTHSTGALPVADGKAPIPLPNEQSKHLDQIWPSLKPGDAELAEVLRNPLGDRLRMLSETDEYPRQTQVTNAQGELIACDGKTDDYFQADEKWWQDAFNGGKGRVYMSSLTVATGDVNPRGNLRRGDPVIEISMPIFDASGATPQVVGVLKDELAVSWLFETLQSVPRGKHLNSLTQLIDLSTGKSVYAVFSDGRNGGGAPEALWAERFFFDHQSQFDPAGIEDVGSVALLRNDIVVGAAQVSVAGELPVEAHDAVGPKWAVIVSQPANVAMTPVYHLAAIVAATGIALILVLFIMGVAITNREIIMPILRLRAATAAVGRGELNVRLLTEDQARADKTFRRDELGDLARDFDEMTRQLQKNVNQLARSNEAKRRFMELAGHELRTPVAYLLGVCQLTQRQFQHLMAGAADGSEESGAVATANRNTAALASGITKIAAKTQRLSRIIDNLLKLVNNDQFTTRLDKQQVDMRALILQVTADHRPFIQERRQQLILDVSENLRSLDADRDKLEDALTNLISNAIRFSPDGSTVRVAAHEVVGDMLEILVEDSGPGIPSEELAHLFEPFYTGEDIMHHHSGTFEFGSKGIGLGLAIVRRFIEMHGGIVRAHGIMRDGKIAGTQFQILLPFSKLAESPEAPASPLTQPR